MKTAYNLYEKIKLYISFVIEIANT